MSVYTQLTDDQFSAFCQRFGVSFARAIPITQGIKNSNWFIQTTDDVDGAHSYVFTLFEERPPEDIEKMAVILNQLDGKLPVAAPLAVIESNASNNAMMINAMLSIMKIKPLRWCHAWRARIHSRPRKRCVMRLARR